MSQPGSRPELLQKRPEGIVLGSRFDDEARNVYFNELQARRNGERVSNPPVSSYPEPPVQVHTGYPVRARGTGRKPVDPKDQRHYLSEPRLSLAKKLLAPDSNTGQSSPFHGWVQQPTNNWREARGQQLSEQDIQRFRRLVESLFTIPVAQDALESVRAILKVDQRFISFVFAYTPVDCRELPALLGYLQVLAILAAFCSTNRHTDLIHARIREVYRQTPMVGSKIDFQEIELMVRRMRLVPISAHEMRAGQHSGATRGASSQPRQTNQQHQQQQQQQQQQRRQGGRNEVITSKL